MSHKQSSLPKLYLKLSLNREITPDFRCLSLFFCQNYSAAKCKIQLSQISAITDFYFFKEIREVLL